MRLRSATGNRGAKDTEPVHASRCTRALVSHDGNGEMTGTNWVEEPGLLKGASCHPPCPQRGPGAGRDECMGTEAQRSGVAVPAASRS